MVEPSKDGCWLFVSLTGGRGGSAGIAVLKRSGGKVDLVRVVRMSSAPTGIRLTHDGKVLVAAAENATVFLDAEKMKSGAADPVAGSIPGGRQSIYVNMTADDSLLFVAEESGAAITAIDLAKARRDGYKREDVIGKIPVGLAPIALTFSPDGKWLYTTSQGAPASWNWPKACKPEGIPVPDSVIANPEGAVIVVDVARAKTDPEHAVVARAPAGCSPVRMTISPRGERIYVTARNSNAVLAFDTAKLVADPDHAFAGIAPAGKAPVPVMAVDDGRKLIVGNSNRFGSGNAPESLVVLDSARISQGLAAVTGVIPTGAFPREMAVSPDGRTLFVTNFGSNSLQALDIRHLPIDTRLPPEIAKNAEAILHRHEHKPITVAPGIVNRYTGVYRSDKGPMVTIGAREGELTFKMGSNPALNAIPESDTKFFAAMFEIEFPAVAEGGRAGQLTLHFGQNAPVYTRLDDAAAKMAQDAAAAFEKRMQENKPLPGSEEALRQLIAASTSGKRPDSLLAPDADASLSALSQMGDVKSIGFQRVGPAGPDIYRVETEKGVWVCRIWMTADGKVERVIAQPEPDSNPPR
jgi:DNA-binding beta-propeller fold protein YncE